jgi:hypothetical protein
MLSLCAVACASLLGCAGQDCSLTQVYSVSPSMATVDHAAKTPDNQQLFLAETTPHAAAGCAVPQYVVRAYPTWTNPDPIDITISSANDNTNGVATCNAATNGAVTLTATSGTGASASVATVQLTCK